MIVVEGPRKKPRKPWKYQLECKNCEAVLIVEETDLFAHAEVERVFLCFQCVCCDLVQHVSVPVELNVLDFPGYYRWKIKKWWRGNK